MLDMIYPTSNAIFYVQRNPPKDDRDWNTLRATALTLAESGNLLMMDTRARDRGAWIRDAQMLIETGRDAYAAAQAKDLQRHRRPERPPLCRLRNLPQQYRPGYRKDKTQPGHMTLLPLFQWIQDSTIGTAIRDSLIVFPIIETAHVVGLALSVGLILITDLRLIGVLMPDIRPVEVTGPMKRWMLGGFTLMFTTGGLLFWAEAAKCYTSPAFRFKILFLLLSGVNALFYETTIGRRFVSWEGMTVLPARVRMAGWVSRSAGPVSSSSDAGPLTD